MNVLRNLKKHDKLLKQIFRETSNIDYNPQLYPIMMDKIQILKRKFKLTIDLFNSILTYDSFNVETIFLGALK